MAEPPRTRPMSDRQFALGRGMWVMTAVTYAFFTLILVAMVTDVLTTSHREVFVFGIAWSVGVVGSGLWVLLGEPRRVEVSPQGLRFIAPARSVLIPWVSLTSVSSPWHDLNRQSLQWRWGRRKLHTWGPYGEDLWELLEIVRERAPAADLRGAVTRRPTWGASRKRR